MYGCRHVARGATARIHTRPAQRHDSTTEVGRGAEPRERRSGRAAGAVLRARLGGLVYGTFPPVLPDVGAIVPASDAMNTPPATNPAVMTSRPARVTGTDSPCPPITTDSGPAGRR